jgi:hypothetical protein
MVRELVCPLRIVEACVGHARQDVKSLTTHFQNQMRMYNRVIDRLGIAGLVKMAVTRESF